jgi:hypothetical protein
MRTSGSRFPMIWCPANGASSWMFAAAIVEAPAERPDDEDRRSMRQSGERMK